MVTREQDIKNEKWLTFHKLLFVVPLNLAELYSSMGPQALPDRARSAGSPIPHAYSPCCPTSFPNLSTPAQSLVSSILQHKHSDEVLFSADEGPRCHFLVRTGAMVLLSLSREVRYASKKENTGSKLQTLKVSLKSDLDLLREPLCLSSAEYTLKSSFE